MRLYFVRHGESEANRARVIANRGWSYPLTEDGRRQARELAMALEAEMHADRHGDRPPVRIVTSPLRRAVETAEVLREVLEAPLEYSSSLREADCGIAEGRSDAAAWRAHDELESLWMVGDTTARIDGGESLDDLLHRFGPWLDGLDDSADGEIVVAVGHGSLYRFVLPSFVGDRDRRAIAPVTIGYADALIAERGKDGSRVLVGMLSDMVRSDHR